MSFSEEWSWPEGHPVSVERAKELMQGDLGRVHYDILARVCSPLYWHVPDDKGARPIRANGTLSYIRADGQVFGVTAAHVITDYLKVEKEPGCVLQLGNAALSADIIDMDEGLDIATLRLNAATLASVGKQIMPVSLSRPNDIPQEGRGIMMCGYPGEDRHQRPNQPESLPPFARTELSKLPNWEKMAELRARRCRCGKLSVPIALP